MIQRVYDILKPLNVPIQYVLRPDISGSSNTGISYHFFNEGYELHGDGIGNHSGGSIQIDVFSTVDYTNVVNQIKEIMKTNKFRLAPGGSRDSDDSFSNVQYYHKILIFNYADEEVK